MTRWSTSPRSTDASSSTTRRWGCTPRSSSRRTTETPRCRRRRPCCPTCSGRRRRPLTCASPCRPARRRTPPSSCSCPTTRYDLAHLRGGGTRERLDRGVLGIVFVRVASAAEAEKLAALEAVGPASGASPSWSEWTASEFEVRSAEPVEVGVDGEALTLQPPLRFVIRPGALTVRLPRVPPGDRPPRAPSGSTRPGPPWLRCGRQSSAVRVGPDDRPDPSWSRSRNGSPTRLSARMAIARPSWAVRLLAPARPRSTAPPTGPWRSCPRRWLDRPAASGVELRQLLQAVVPDRGSARSLRRGPRASCRRDRGGRDRASPRSWSTNR